MGLSIKSIGKALGKVAKVAAPFLPLGLSQAASFGGSVLSGGNIKDHLKTTAMGTIGNLLGGASTGRSIASGLKGLSGSALKNAGLKAVGMAPMSGGAGGTAGLMEKYGSILNGAPSITPHAGSATSGLGSIFSKFGVTPSTVSTKAGGNPLIQGLGDLLKGKVTGGKALTLGNVLSGVGGVAKRNPELLAAGAAGLYGAKKSSDAAKRREKAIAAATGRYGELAPLRTMGLAGLMNPGAGRPNLAPIFADPYNPYSRAGA